MEETKRPSVAVLMSTYNGEKYLREQLDSILNQKDVDVHIFIRDDGSKDKTVEIIREYMDASIHGGEVKQIDFTQGENLGSSLSFMEQLYQSPDTYDYYAFSDQDDVWFEDKLIVGINFLKTNHKELYASNQIYTDKDLTPLGPLHADSDTSPYGVMAFLRGNGCTLIFTNHFHALLKAESHRPDPSLFGARCHDSWTVMVGAVLGLLAYDTECHMYYRQHGNNSGVTKNYRYDGMWAYAKKRLKVAIPKLLDKSRRGGCSRLAREIIRCFPDEAARFPYLEVYANADKLANKIKLTFSYKEYRKHRKKSFAEFFALIWLNLI